MLLDRRIWSLLFLSPQKCSGHACTSFLRGCPRPQNIHDGIQHIGRPDTISEQEGSALSAERTMICFSRCELSRPAIGSCSGIEASAQASFIQLKFCSVPTFYFFMSWNPTDYLTLRNRRYGGTPNRGAVKDSVEKWEECRD